MIRKFEMEVCSQSLRRWCGLAAFSAFAGFFLPVTQASAVSARVKFACANDYYAHCSQFSPNSPEVRRCMRAAGDSLSPRCVNALVADGEVSDKEVAAHESQRDDRN